MRKTIKQVKKAAAALMALVMVLGVGVPVMADAGTTRVVEIYDGITMTVHDVAKTTTAQVLRWIDTTGAMDTWTYYIEDIEIYWIPLGSEVIITGNINEASVSQFNYWPNSDGVYQPDASAGIWAENNTWGFVIDSYSATAWSAGVRGATVFVRLYAGDEDTPETQPTPTNNIAVTINGEAVDFADQHPTIIDGRTLVPVRDVFETLGFDVSWNDETQEVRLVRDSFIFIIEIGSYQFILGTSAGFPVGIPLDVPAQIINGRTMLPIRALLEALGYNIDWDGDTQTVIISTN